MLGVAVNQVVGSVLLPFVLQQHSLIIIPAGVNTICTVLEISLLIDKLIDPLIGKLIILSRLHETLGAAHHRQQLLHLVSFFS